MKTPRNLHHGSPDESLRSKSLSRAESETELFSHNLPATNTGKQQRRYEIADAEFSDQQRFNDAGKVNDQVAYSAFAETRKTLGMPVMDPATAGKILEGGDKFGNGENGATGRSRQG